MEGELYNLLSVLHIFSTTNQCLSTTANCNNVFRSTFKNQQWLVATFLFPQWKYCRQGSTFVLCNQRAPSDVKPKQGIIKCIINIQILFQIHQFLHCFLKIYTISHVQSWQKDDANIEKTVCSCVFFSCIQMIQI